MTRISPLTSSGGETVGMAPMGLCETESARFEIGEQGLDIPACRISQGVRYPGLADMAMIQGASRPASTHHPPGLFNALYLAPQAR